MSPILRFMLCWCTVLSLIVLPAAALPVLISDSFNPNPPFVAGGQQEVAASYAIPGGTIFPSNHELQMQTDLVDARWTIQVILDGNNAARQTVSGSAAFINGEILSYSVNHDVRFYVTINGKVPASATGTVTALQLVEIDNSGGIVPGSQSMISQPVTGAVPSSVRTPVPTLTPLLVTTSPPVTKLPGFSLVIGILGCSLAAFIRMHRGFYRCTRTLPAPRCCPCSHVLGNAGHLRDRALYVCKDRHGPVGIQSGPDQKRLCTKTGRSRYHLKPLLFNCDKRSLNKPMMIRGEPYVRNHG